MNKPSSTETGQPAELPAIFYIPPPPLPPPFLAVPPPPAGEASHGPAVAPHMPDCDDLHAFARALLEPDSSMSTDLDYSTQWDIGGSALWDLMLEAQQSFPNRKCKRCELTEFRLQHNRAQVAQAMRSSRELDEKLERIINKNKKLQELLNAMLKPKLLPASASHADDTSMEAMLIQMKVLLTKLMVGDERGAEEAASCSSHHEHL